MSDALAAAMADDGPKAPFDPADYYPAKLAQPEETKDFIMQQTM